MGATEYRLTAYNTAGASENKIHDDAVARRFGFRGGLVPGVDVYAYLTHPVVARWGRAWLERGRASVRFLQPVYDGEEVVVRGVPAAEGTLDLEARSAAGVVCATLHAALPSAVPPAPDLASYPAAALPAAPPRASAETLAPGTVLGVLESELDAERAPAYLADVRETLPLYRDERLAHPGWLLRRANYILAANVRLGPWIHVASDVQHLGTAVAGERVSTRGRVTRAYEKKGHRFVELALLMMAGGARPILQVRHTAIYEPRGSAGPA